MRYLIIGAGRQGAACAYDLGREGATVIVLADRDVAVAQAAATRINGLLGRELCQPMALSADDTAGVRAAMLEAEVVLSAVPYYFNVALSKLAIETRRHFVDMGGNTDVVREQLALDADARAAGVVLLPDCGMGPGLVNVLAVFAMAHLDEPRALYMADAGLPQHPEPPWNYLCGFHLNGLTNEYDGMVPLLRDGRIVEVEALSGLRTEDLGELGTYESFIAAGGSTAPWSFEGRVQTFETRLLRLPGHHTWFSAFKALGLFSETPVEFQGRSIVPREFYHILLAKHLTRPSFEDMCIMHCRAEGTLGGDPTRVVVTLRDQFDPATGFTGMERLTGWHCAIMMEMIAQGRVQPGARALEARLLDAAPTARAVMDEVARRGIEYKVAFSTPKEF